MKKVPVFFALVLSLLLLVGAAYARGGHGGGHAAHGSGHFYGGHGHFYGGHHFYGGGRFYGRSFARGGVYGWPYYGYYPGWEWVPGYWTQECTPYYCRPVWVPGYWRRW